MINSWEREFLLNYVKTEDSRYSTLMLDVDSGQWCSLGQFTSYNEMVGWVGSSSRFVQNVINNPKNEPRYINQGCAAAGGGILNFWWNPTFQDKFYLEFIQLTIFTWYTEIFAESAFKQVAVYD